MAHRKLASLYLLLCLLLLINSCASIGARQSPDIYYTIPAVTYLRELPGYGSQNVATLYHGEQVTILSKIADDWCQVQVGRSQQVGWIQRPLLSQVPIHHATYYVQVNKIPLREAPQEEVMSRHVLQRGDKVRKISENQQGWWRVLVDKDKSLGWVPAAAVSLQTPEKAPTVEVVKTDDPLRPVPKHSYYVATTSLKLHLLPLVSSQVVKVLKFNNKVEKVSQSGNEWLKVRYLETGAQGWALARYLSNSPAKAPKTFTRKRKRVRKRPKDLRPEKEKITVPEKLDPEVM
jgi:uncharacterized protein YgiM (DUF1202 family)